MTAHVEHPPPTLDDEEDRRIAAMLARALTHGITPLEPELRRDPGRSRPSAGTKGDRNIGVAILGSEAFFYRTGHHRLAIALALGLAEVPVDITLWDKSFNRLGGRERTELLANLGIRDPWGA